MKIAIVTSRYIEGGPKIATLNLYKGLKLEGYDVSLVMLAGDLASRFYKDLTTIKKLTDLDVVIYTGSKAWLSQMFIKSKKALFIHGFVRSEFLDAIKLMNLRGILGAAPLLAYWRAFNNLKFWDFYLCHSKTTCETNGIYDDYVVLPQFVLSTDIKFYEKISDYRIQNNAVRILTYSSLVGSSRLLKTENIVTLAEKISKRTSRKFELVIVDPKTTIKSTSSVKITGYMPRKEFLKLLASSDLYIERCVDEELRYGSLEAGLLGVPVAKVTYPKYLTRQDYSDNQVIIATSGNELASKVAEYVNNINYYRECYSDQIRKFITNVRSWNKVKEPLITKLKDN